MMLTNFLRVTAVALMLSSLSPVASTQAQEMPSPEQMEQLQQMLEQMQNDPAFQEQMRQMQEIIGQQDEDMTPFLDPGFIGQLGQYQKCISDDLGSDWILSVGQRMTPYIQQIQGLCQAGRFSAAKAYLEDEDNAKQFFSSREWTVMDRCQQQFPEESMLSMQPDPNQTGQEICRDFMN